MTIKEKKEQLSSFIVNNFNQYDDGIETLEQLSQVMGDSDLLAEFNYFADERLDKDDFVTNLREICQCRADEYQELADRLELLREKLFEKNSYECGDRPKIGY
jgi:hypothetical protein